MKDFGCPEINGTDWVDIGKVTFNILDGKFRSFMLAYDSVEYELQCR